MGLLFINAGCTGAVGGAGPSLQCAAHRPLLQCGAHGAFFWQALPYPSNMFGWSVVKMSVETSPRDSGQRSENSVAAEAIQLKLGALRQEFLLQCLAQRWSQTDRTSKWSASPPSTVSPVDYPEEALQDPKPFHETSFSHWLKERSAAPNVAAVLSQMNPISFLAMAVVCRADLPLSRSATGDPQWIDW